MANNIVVTPPLAGSSGGRRSPYDTPTPDLGPQYQALLDANPYKNLTYRKSPWQSIVEALGFRSNADAWQENMAAQAAEYDAAIAQKAYDEQYNSAGMQAERLRAAGINPDINGGQNIDAGEAAKLPEDLSNPPQSTASDLTPVWNFANACMSALTLGSTLAKDFAGLKNMGIVNRAGEIQNTRAVAEFADWVASNFYKSPHIWDNPSFDMSSGEEISTAISTANDYFDQYRKNIPRRYRKQFAKNLATSLMSFKGSNTRYDTAVQYLTNKKKYNELRGEPTFKNGMSDDAVMDVLKPLSELSFKVDKLTREFNANMAQYQRDLYDPDKRETGESLDPSLTADAQNSQNLYNRNYYSEKSPTAAAMAENATNSNVFKTQRFDMEINDTYREIIHNLTIDAARGNAWARGQLAAWTIMKLSSDAGLGGMAANVLKAATL